jgi:hypothetical protein
MRITQGGNVGIGNASPTAKLDIRGGSISLGSYDTSSGSRYVGFYNVNDTNGPLVGMEIENTTLTGNYSQKVHFRTHWYGTNSGRRMTIAEGGAVGVATESPYAPLHVYNGTAGAPLTTGTNSDPSTILRVHCVSIGLDFGVYGSGGAWIQNRQITVSFGTNYPINLNPNGGGVSIGAGSSALTYALEVTGSIRATADIIAYSDSRVKTDLRLIENALDKVSNINGYTFVRTDQEDKETRHAGVVAQEVLEVLPEVVYKDKEDRYSVAYGNLTALLIEALKEESRKREALEERLARVETNLKFLGKQ